jgi:hypothetical protein
MSNKTNIWFKNKIKKGINYNNRFIFIIFIIISIVLIIILLLNIFVSAELLTKIDDYVTVYNQIHSSK